MASQVKQDLAEAASIGTDAIELAVSAGSVTVLATMPVFAVLEILDQISRKELQTLGGIPVVSARVHKPGKEPPVGLVPVPPGGDSPASSSSSDGSYAWVGIVAAVVAVVLAIGAAVRIKFRNQKNKNQAPPLHPPPLHAPPPPPPPLSSPALAQCSTPGCSRESWDGKEGSACCRTCARSGGASHGPACGKKAGHVPPQPPGTGDLQKFICPGQSIRFGTLEDAMHGIGSILLGSTDADQKLAEYTLEGEAAIEREFMHNGSAEDRSNFTKVRDGTFPDGKTLEQLMKHKSTKVAKLQRYHVLALRLYTSSSYSKINNPMRSEPPARPHPFAATTFFVFDAIKKLRTVESQGAAGKKPLTLWRGVSGLSLTQDFMTDGGCELACMSATASLEMAKAFALQGPKPMVFKYETIDRVPPND